MVHELWGNCDNLDLSENFEFHNIRVIYTKEKCVCFFIIIL